ncbi:MAG: efflux RND transporter periplasmic adaptor subunit [Planctomycetes bacterium]|nr:efflux RND transporter periplasmic adaptor subunit [Planctomycetota bacterium]
MKRSARPRRPSIPGLGVAQVALAVALSGCGGDAPGGGHSGHDHGPPGASSDEVTLTHEQVEGAGIRTVLAQPGAILERLRLTAVVHENLDTQAHLTPKVPGLVRSIRKRLGDRVEAGEVLCELESTELGQAASSYMEARASLEAGQRLLEQEALLLERGVEVAQTIFAREERLKEQQLTTLRPYYEAEKALAQAKLERDTRVLSLRAALEQREIQLHTAEERLKILGLTSDDLARLDRDEEHGHGRYPLRAPRSGLIVARDITENEYVETSSKLFLIQDLSRVWIMASVYERDLRHVERGQRAEVQLDAFPGVTLKGEVTFVDYKVDPASRACEVRIELPNEPIPGWSELFPLRPGLFGTVELVLTEHQAAVSLPERAIVHEGELSFVFLALETAEEHEAHEEHETHDGHEAGHDDHDEGGPRQRFVRRRVELGARGGDRVEVLSGIEAGARVVVEGTFTLKSAARQGELGGGHSH